jgi:aspartyl-tRNA(Asn)/glutamyl-tRNA(Gln) amidotransferase subunit A
MNDFLKGTILQLLQAYRSHQTSPVEVCEKLFERIAKYDSKIGAYVPRTSRPPWLDRERVLKEAAEAEKHLDLPLAGVPLAIKDVISTNGIETTCSSRILKNYVPPYDATAIARLKAAGALIIGKTNCDEFAMGSSTENSAYQLTRNPWNTLFTPGGSSGGSAAAVASCFAFGALGSDTGGSVRQPASFCGVVGLKPTYGRVSRNGLVAFGSSLDCIGTFARSAEDAALLLQTIGGYDSADTTSSALPVPDYLSSMHSGQKLRVGIPAEYFQAGIDSEVARLVENSLRSLEQMGKIEIRSISLPHTEYAIAVYYVIATAEASSNLSRFDGVRYGYRAPEKELRKMYERTRENGFGAEVKRRIMLGTFALSAGYYDAYYKKASEVRSLIAEDFQKAFERVDLICAPTAPTVAFRIGEKVDDPLAMYLSDVFTVTMSLAGLPAISVPCGMHSSGLPCGLQIVGNYMEETKIFSLASTLLQEQPLKLPELQ